MTTRTRSIDCFFQDAPKRADPSQASPVQKNGNEGKVLTAAEILDKGTRSVEAITVIAVVVGLTVGGYALWRAFKAKAEEEEQEEAMIAAIVEEETMREYRRAPPDPNWGGPYNEASGQLADHYAKHGRGRLSALPREGQRAMASFNQKKLAQWVAKQILIERDDGSCRRLVVRHLVAGKSGSIGEVVVSDRTDTETIADEISTIIEEDAKELGDRQTYSVRAFFGRSSKEEVGGKDRFTASVYHEGEAEDSLSSEPPTMRGIVAQQMRHNEAILRTSVASMGQTLEHMARINQTLANRLEKLEEGRFAQLETFEELLSKRHERELEATKLSNAEKRKEQVFEKLALLLPAVANKIVGKKVFPENLAGDMAELKTLLSSITPEQLTKLGDVLTPAQATAMLSVYEKFAAEDKVETKASNGAIVRSSS